MTLSALQILTEALLSQTADDKSKAMTARLRDVYPLVEAALAAGFSREQVLTAIQAGEVNMKRGGFIDAIHRIRKERAEAGVRAPLRVSAAARSTPASSGPVSPQETANPTAEPGSGTESSDVGLEISAGGGKSFSKRILEEPRERRSFKSIMKDKEQK